MLLHRRPDPENFCYRLIVFVGSEGEKGADSFNVMVCSPKWLRSKPTPNGSASGSVAGGITGVSQILSSHGSLSVSGSPNGLYRHWSYRFRNQTIGKSCQRGCLPRKSLGCSCEAARDSTPATNSDLRVQVRTRAASTDVKRPYLRCSVT